MPYTSDLGPLAGHVDSNGNAVDTDSCVAGCVPASCGDGLVREGVEACDDGNDIDGDSCSNDCALPTCGDAVVQPGEECDDGNGDDTDDCLSTCLLTKCGDGIVQQGEACDDGNDVNGGLVDFCLNSCEAFDPTICKAPSSYVICDEAIDLNEKNDPAQVHRALGICDQDPESSIVLTKWSFKVEDEASWQLARGFGSLYTPREGSAFLMLSTGHLPPPDKQTGVVVMSEFPSSNNENPDGLTQMPKPMSPLKGSNGGGGGTPMIDCDGVNDCSDSLAEQWAGLGNSAANDALSFTLETEVPWGTYGYTFDFVLCSTEWPQYVGQSFNDMFVAWQVDPTPDMPWIDAYTGNVAFISDPDDPGALLPLTVTSLDSYFAYEGYTGASPQLSGTGFEGHACTGWSTATGAVQPGADLTISMFIADMGDTAFDTVVLLDNFRWGCIGCIPDENTTCGIESQ